MALTEKERFLILNTIKNTRRDHGATEYPAECYGFYELAKQETIPFAPVDGHPFTVYRFEGKNRGENCPIHINIHGGGFIYPHEENDSMFSAYLADAIGGIVLDVDYTTSDKAAFPVALHQCYEVARFAFSKCEEWNADPKRVSIGGYSAGGSLTAGVTLLAAQSEEFHFCLQVLGYPLLDSVTPPKYKRKNVVQMMPLERGIAFNELYFDGPSTNAEPTASPMYAPDELLAKMPRTLVCSAASCDFKFENEDYAQKLVRLGVEVTVKRFPNTGHGFIPHFMSGWKEACELIISSILSAKV